MERERESPNGHNSQEAGTAPGSPMCMAATQACGPASADFPRCVSREPDGKQSGQNSNQQHPW